MASNGVILLNLSNRNAADFQRLEVPDSYEKASGALTAGTYVTVYKWLYQGFMMAPSLCDAVDADDHINLVDRTNGGILEVYPDDTIEIPSEPGPGPGPGPEPEPGAIVHDDPYYRKAVKVYTKTGVEGKIFIENGITVGDGNLKTFVGDGIEVEISASSLVGYQPGVYAVPGICIIQHGGTAPNGDWYFTSIADMNIYSPTLSTPWTYVGPGHSVTQGWPDDGSETDFYYVFEHRNINPGSASDVTLVPLSVTEDGQYAPEDYDADGFSSVLVDVISGTVDGEYTPEFISTYASLYAGGIFVKDRHAYMVSRITIASMQAVKIGTVPDAVKPANIVYFRIGNGSTTSLCYGKILPDGGIYITSASNIGNYGYLYAEWEVPEISTEFVINSNTVNYIEGCICVIGDTCFACSKISINSSGSGWKENLFSIPESLTPQSSVTGTFYYDPYDTNSMSPAVKDVQYDDESRAFSIWLPSGTQVGTFRAVWKVQSTII